ncbi:hypothetical protein Poly51_01190 [Rubripirellula tenax]|uniref:FlgN protein n=1 Tax=Rubripirellula tenax TaxID=2528015 RepID=A0A5C6FDJ3_9BACT|nr:hypothetical protein [Rubripirellula tenax]TWU59846.1 hypothetical protein Poly51_01190 [Rubripirellula tenax]
MDWTNRVETYLNELEQTAEIIDLILDETRVRTIGVQTDDVSESTRQLKDALADLETKIAEREDLLRDADAPPSGLTLTEKLAGSLRIEDARLASRCRDLAGTIQKTHTRAVSLFVCQYHLADLTTNLVGILSGASRLQTYRAINDTERPSKAGGGLFDEAA